jgi:integrase
MNSIGRDEPWTLRQEVTHKGTPYARVRWVLYLHKAAFGRAKKLYFGTKKEATASAKRKLADLRAHGQQATHLSDVQRADAVKAFTFLRESACTATLEEAVRDYVKRHPKKREVTVRQVVLQFLAARGVSEKELVEPGKHRSKEARERVYHDNALRHRTSLASRLRPFVERWGNVSIRTLTEESDEFENWLRDKMPKCVRRKWHKGEAGKLDAVTVDNNRRSIHSVFNFAISRKLCTKNPAKRWDELKHQLKRRRNRKPGILQPDELRSLLAAACEHDPPLVVPIALGAFSGVRTAEFSRVTWRMIQRRIIHLPPEVTKTETAAELNIHPALRSCLSFASRGDEDDFIVPDNYGKRRQVLCRKIGLKWPNNALRHSFGSYRYALTKDIAGTAYEMRHEDIETFRRWYLNRGVTHQMGKDYFAIRLK